MRASVCFCVCVHVLRLVVLYWRNLKVYYITSYLTVCSTKTSLNLVLLRARSVRVNWKKKLNELSFWRSQKKTCTISGDSSSTAAAAAPKITWINKTDSPKFLIHSYCNKPFSRSSAEMVKTRTAIVIVIVLPICRIYVWMPRVTARQINMTSYKWQIKIGIRIWMKKSRQCDRGRRR